MEILLAAIVGLVAGLFLGRWFFAAAPPPSVPSGTEAALAPLQGLLTTAQDDLKEKQLECQHLTHELAKAERDKEHAEERYREREREVGEMQARFRQEFSLLAETLLEEKGKKLGEQQNAQLSGLLVPLQEKLNAFDQQISQARVEEAKQRQSLEDNIRQLTDLNQQMGEDARRLTEALKGNSKVQGNWGELVLERILEQSGLFKGREYKTQESYRNDQDQRLVPDVVILLPEDRHLVVDSKVSLTAYERYVSAEDAAERDKHRREHVLSLRNHIKSLGEKDYSSLPGLRSPEFVLLFVAVEPAFQLALQADGELLTTAYQHRVILVGPTSLLATTTTVANLWRHERQNQNAQLIAKLGGELVDKLAGFMGDLESVRKALGNADKALDQASRKLHEGKGNILSKARKLQELGARSNKQLPAPYETESDDEDADESSPLLPESTQEL